MTMNLNGTTGIVLPTAAAPAFSAYINTNQSVTSGVAVKAQINTKEFDTNNNYDSTTNYRFTPTVAGYYQINGSVAAATTGACFAVCYLYKNGAAYKNGNYTNNSNGANITVSSIVYFNGTTDYVELWAYIVGTSPTISGTTSVTTYLNGCYLRSA